MHGGVAILPPELRGPHCTKVLQKAGGKTAVVVVVVVVVVDMTAMTATIYLIASDINNDITI